MRRAFFVTLVLAAIAACSSFGDEEEPSTGTDGGTLTDGGGNEAAPTDAPTLDAREAGVVEIEDAGPPPVCNGEPVVNSGFESFPLPYPWSLNDTNGSLGLDVDRKSADLSSMRAGPYNDVARAMISWVNPYVPARTRFCLSIDLSLLFTAVVGTGFVEVLQVNLTPSGGAGKSAFIGVGVDSGGVFVHFIGVGASTPPNKTIAVPLASDENLFHRWTFTVDITGMKAWVDAKRFASEAFPVTGIEKVDISLGAQGGKDAPRPTVTSHFDQLQATFPL